MSSSCAALWSAAALSILCLTAASADLTAQVRATGSGPRLFINGEPRCPTILYVSLFHDDDLTRIAQSEIADAVKAGVDIISFVIWGLPWFRDGEAADFSKHDVDVWVDKVLAANPNALLLPRFPTDWPPDWWREAHPDDVMQFADGKRDGPASIHSLAWRRDAATQVATLVRHLEAKYGDHMVGYHPCGQTSAEWFYEGMWDGRLASFEGVATEGFRRFLRGRYGTDAALRAAWHAPGVTLETAPVPTADERTACSGSLRDPATQQAVVDFSEFINLDMADAVAAMCHAVKEVTPTKLAVAFYGYDFELASAPRGLASSGHLGLARLLRSPDVDILCSPVTYGDRQPGGGGFLMSPVDSVLRSGKLWLTEDDTRTHLSAPDAFPGRCADVRETRGVLTRNFAHTLSRGAAVWWMDISGRGWFAGDEMWSDLSRLHGAYADALPALEPYAPQIAVIVDERSTHYVAPSPLITAPLMDGFRRQWYRIGAPVGVYLLDDLLAGRVPAARMYIMLNAFRLDGDQLAALRDRACRDGRTVVWMYAPGIVRDGELSPGRISEATRIALEGTASGDGELVIDRTGQRFSADHGRLEPTLAVADPRAHVLARYASGGQAAIASKGVGDWTSVYCGTLQMPANLLRRVAEQAGVHVYSPGGDVVAAGNGFVSIHASSSGRKVLRMPAECRLVDAMTGEAMGPAREFRFPMALGDTRLMRVVP